MLRWSRWLVPCGVCDITFRTEPSKRLLRGLTERGGELVLDSVLLFDRDQRSTPLLTIGENWFTARDYLLEQLI